MRDPRALIDTATLAASLGDPTLRVFDCTTYLNPTPAGSHEPYIAVPGRRTFEDGHFRAPTSSTCRAHFPIPLRICTS